jgi:hypothetical protein
MAKPHGPFTLDAILAIEDEAAAAPPIDVERLADALTAAPSLLLEGDERDRKEFAGWLLARLSGPPSGGTDE